MQNPVSRAESATTQLVAFPNAPPAPVSHSDLPVSTDTGPESRCSWSRMLARLRTQPWVRSMAAPWRRRRPVLTRSDVISAYQGSQRDSEFCSVSQVGAVVGYSLVARVRIDHTSSDREDRT